MYSTLLIYINESFKNINSPKRLLRKRGMEVWKVRGMAFEVEGLRVEKLRRLGVNCRKVEKIFGNKPESVEVGRAFLPDNKKQ